MQPPLEKTNMLTSKCPPLHASQSLGQIIEQSIEYGRVLSSWNFTLEADTLLYVKGRASGLTNRVMRSVIVPCGLLLIFICHWKDGMPRAHLGSGFSTSSGERDHTVNRFPHKPYFPLKIAKVPVKDGLAFHML